MSAFLCVSTAEVRCGGASMFLIKRATAEQGSYSKNRASVCVDTVRTAPAFIGTKKPTDSAETSGKELDTPPFEGWLAKKSHSGIHGMRVWHRRFFVLDGAGLRWFDDDRKKDLTRGTIRLFEIRHAEPVPEKGPGRFLLICRSDRGQLLYDFMVSCSWPCGWKWG